MSDNSNDKSVKTALNQIKAAGKTLPWLLTARWLSMTTGIVSLIGAIVLIMMAAQRAFEQRSEIASHVDSEIKTRKLFSATDFSKELEGKIPQMVIDSFKEGDVLENVRTKLVGDKLDELLSRKAENLIEAHSLQIIAQRLGADPSFQSMIAMRITASIGREKDAEIKSLQTLLTTELERSRDRQAKNELNVLELRWELEHYLSTSREKTLSPAKETLRIGKETVSEIYGVTLRLVAINDQGTTIAVRKYGTDGQYGEPLKFDSENSSKTVPCSVNDKDVECDLFVLGSSRWPTRKARIGIVEHTR